jgi:hypothetical protein
MTKTKTEPATAHTSPVSLQTQSESASSLVSLQTRSGSVASPLSWHRPSQGQLNLPCFLADPARELQCFLIRPSQSQLAHLSPGRFSQYQLPHPSLADPVNVSCLTCLLSDSVRVSCLTRLLADPLRLSCLTCLLADPVRVSVEWILRQHRVTVVQNCGEVGSKLWTKNYRQ